MRRIAKRLYRDETGGVLVEATVMISILFIFVLGAIDFLRAMYEWNAAAKAVALGARVAAVSSPVSSDLSTITGLEGGANPGDPMPNFGTRTCTASSDGSSGSCIGGTFDATAFRTIFYGRGSSQCGDATSFYDIGMCDVFPFLKDNADKVVISYMYTGLGYAGRPGGPVPTITVALQNMPFQFFFLNGLLGFGDIIMPSLTTSVTGEDLSSSAP